MPEIQIHKRNRCGRRCPALVGMEREIEIAHIQREIAERRRVFSMLTDEQSQTISNRAQNYVDAKIALGELKLGPVGSAFCVCYRLALAYKYACEILGIEPKTWSTL